MSVAGISGSVTAYVGKTANVSQSAGLSYNHQQAVEATNKKSGSNYSIDVEQRAANAQLVSVLV